MEKLFEKGYLKIQELLDDEEFDLFFNFYIFSLFNLWFDQYKSKNLINKSDYLRVKCDKLKNEFCEGKKYDQIGNDKKTQLCNNYRARALYLTNNLTDLKSFIEQDNTIDNEEEILFYKGFISLTVIKDNWDAYFTRLKSMNKNELEDVKNKIYLYFSKANALENKLEDENEVLFKYEQFLFSRLGLISIYLAGEKTRTNNEKCLEFIRELISKAVNIEKKTFSEYAQCMNELLNFKSLKNEHSTPIVKYYFKYYEVTLLYLIEILIQYLSENLSDQLTDFEKFLKNFNLESMKVAFQDETVFSQISRLINFNTLKYGFYYHKKNENFYTDFKLANVVNYVETNLLRDEFFYIESRFYLCYYYYYKNDTNKKDDCKEYLKYLDETINHENFIKYGFLNEFYTLFIEANCSDLNLNGKCEEYMERLIENNKHNYEIRLRTNEIKRKLLKTKLDNKKIKEDDYKKEFDQSMKDFNQIPNENSKLYKMTKFSYANDIMEGKSFKSALLIFTELLNLENDYDLNKNEIIAKMIEIVYS